MKIDSQSLSASMEAWIRNDDFERAGPRWLQWVWTLLFAAVLAIFFTVLGFFAFGSGKGAWRNLAGWAEWYGKNFVVCLTVASSIHLMFDILRSWWATPARIRAWTGWQRTVFFAGVPMVGVVVGWPIGIALAGGNIMRWLASDQSQNIVVGTMLMTVMLSLVLHYWFSAKAQQFDAERRATEAQLRMLQAQIEPHFLFNTLANVQSLMDHDPPKAKQMLTSFTDYLRASLGSLRDDNSAVAQELDLAQSYLQLLQGRMEDRLRFEIKADTAARRQPLPPLLLQPLVENAVVHGLEPSIEGGTVRITARVDGQRLVLEVQDDGRGLDAPVRPGARQGQGMALDNIRQRLRARYGLAATLEVQAAHPGTLARITVPLQAAAI
jgi:two-component sensor histidine kinase